MDEPQAMTPAPSVTSPRLLAANGPRMLALSGEITDGAVPTLMPPEYTRRARAVQEHLEAGADHVRLGVIAPDFATGIEQMVTLGSLFRGW